MIKIIDGKNVNDIYVEGLHWLRAAGIEEGTRNGMVLVSPWPVMSVYMHPWERVLFDHQRNANPFFHLAEAIWMLAGSNDAAWVGQFNKQMLAYVDGDGILKGAYGYRWRYAWGRDQILDVVHMLRKDPYDRRAVICMWDPTTDLNTTSKDVPCNTTLYFRMHNQSLEMTVCCRSNDAVWGAYGANAVHFSILHEFISLAVAIPQGKMYQLSNNFHIYERHWDLMKTPHLKEDPYSRHIGMYNKEDPYNLPDDLRVLPLFRTPPLARQFLRECQAIVAGNYGVVEIKFLRSVVVPMIKAYLDRPHAPEILTAVSECDWKQAAIQWIKRSDDARDNNGQKASGRDALQNGERQPAALEPSDRP